MHGLLSILRLEIDNHNDNDRGEDLNCYIPTTMTLKLSTMTKCLMFLTMMTLTVMMMTICSSPSGTIPKEGKCCFFFFDGDDLNNLFQSEQRQTTHKWGDEAGSSGKFGHIAFGSSSLSSIIIVI